MIHIIEKVIKENPITATMGDEDAKKFVSELVQALTAEAGIELPDDAELMSDPDSALLKIYTPNTLGLIGAVAEQMDAPDLETQVQALYDKIAEACKGHNYGVSLMAISQILTVLITDLQSKV